MAVLACERPMDGVEDIARSPAIRAHEVSAMAAKAFAPAQVNGSSANGRCYRAGKDASLADFAHVNAGRGFDEAAFFRRNTHFSRLTF